MNQHSPLKPRGSLLERAAQVYDFSAAIRAPVIPARTGANDTAPTRPVSGSEEGRSEGKKPKKPLVLSAPEPEIDDPLELEAEFEAEAEVQAEARDEAPAHSETAAPFPIVLFDGDAERPRQATPARACRYGTVDREGLLDAGFILPDAPVSALAEEFRIIKRQLLLKVSGRGELPEDKRQTILVCSAQPDEGKTFCALNLALSLAGERDVEVLLVDGDFAKPEILSILGLEGGPGLIDAIMDPDSDPNAFVIETDVRGLSVLPAGRQANDVTELLSSERTRQVIAELTRNHPKRVVIFDSPPALMASPATVLATHVGQVVMIVRADQTTEADLKEAVTLLSGCEHLSLMLNATGFAVGGRRFGSYYGYGQ
jgi:exopolysaccharide/PEP-CTERM locus tyrosine autokinase